MMILIAHYIGWFAVTTLAGLSVLLCIGYERQTLFRVERLAFAYPLGLGLITIQMALLSLFGAPYTAVSILVPWIPLFFALFIVHARTTNGRPPRIPPRRAMRLLRSEKIMIAALVLTVAYVFFRALIKPLEAYDAIAIYALKAKIFYLAGGIPPGFFGEFRELVPHVEYPLLVPLAETYFYTFWGDLADGAVKIVFPLYYAAILATVYCLMRRILARAPAILFTVLLATVPQFAEYATNGYADIVLAFYFTASFSALLVWMREGGKSLLVLSALFAALGIWTKTEGLLLAAVNAAVALLYSITNRRDRSSRSGFGYAVAVVAVVAAYFFLNRLLGLSVHSDFAQGDIFTWHALIGGMKRLPAILYEYQIQFFGPKKWNIVWIIFFLLFFTNIRKAFSGAARPITLAVLMAFAGYTGVYMITPQDIGWHLSTTASRLFLHLLPPVIVWIAVMSNETGYRLWDRKN